LAVHGAQDSFQHLYLGSCTLYRDVKRLIYPFKGSGVASEAPPMVLLGAGASHAAEVPMAGAMTRKIIDSIEGSPPNFAARSALNYVVATMVAAQTLEGWDPYASVDVERVFSAIEVLAERRTHELAPFVEWRPAVEDLDKPVANPFAVQNFANLLVKLVPQAGRRSSAPNATQIGQNFRRAIAASVPAGLGNGRVYPRVMELMLAALRRAVNVEDANRVQYLCPLVHSARDSSATIATLNYDRTIEMACGSEGIPCTTGIEDWSRTGAFVPPSKGIYLLKLHGSIDWRFVGPGLHSQESDNARQESYDAAHLIAKVVDVVVDNESSYQPAVMFGARGKLRLLVRSLTCWRSFRRRSRDQHAC
jgi:hypothetical protein